MRREQAQDFQEALLQIGRAIPAMFVGLEKVQHELQHVTSVVRGLSDLYAPPNSTVASIQAIASLPPLRREEVLRMLQRWHDEDANADIASRGTTEIQLSPTGSTELKGAPAQVAQLQRVRDFESATQALLQLAASSCPTATIHVAPRITDGVRETVAYVRFPTDDENAMVGYCELLARWIEHERADVLTLQFERQ